MSYEKITTKEELEQVLGEEQILLFKASTTCPISKFAFQQYENFMKKHLEVKSYYLYVQEARELSNYIAEKYNVKHESPQVLLVKGDQVLWNASHGEIVEDILKEKVIG